MSRLQNALFSWGRGDGGRRVDINYPNLPFKKFYRFLPSTMLKQFLQLPHHWPNENILTLQVGLLICYLPNNFCCRKLHLKILRAHLIRSSLSGRRMLYINSHFTEEICKYFFHSDIYAVDYSLLFHHFF